MRDKWLYDAFPGVSDAALTRKDSDLLILWISPPPSPSTFLHIGSNSRCASWKRYGDAPRIHCAFFYYSSVERSRCVRLRRRSDLPINTSRTEIRTWIGIKAKKIYQRFKCVGSVIVKFFGAPKGLSGRKIGAQWACRSRRRNLNNISIPASPENTTP